MSRVAILLALMATTRPLHAESADAPRNEADPMTSQVAPPPAAIIDPLSEQEYKTLFAKALHDAGAVPTADQLPLTGVRITAVTEDSPADQASLHVGDIIVAVDDVAIPNFEILQAARQRAAGDQTFAILPADLSARRKVTVPSGPLGMQAEDAWIAESQYIRSLPAGAAPVDEIRIAARCAVANPRLAESALAHAQKNNAAGVNGPNFNAIAAQALHRDGWFEDALSYATAASQGLPEDAQPMLKRIIFDSAIATFRYPLATKIAQEDPRFAEVLPGVTDAINAYQRQAHQTAEPNPAAAKLAFTDQTANVVNTAPDRNNEARSSVFALAHLVHDDTIPFSTPDGRYSVCRCSPAGANVDFSADCHFKASDNGKSGYVKVVRVGVEGDLEQTLELYVDGSADVTADVNAATPKLDLTQLTGGDRKFRLRMSIVGDRYEFTIDGRRVFYGPMPASAQNLTLSIQTVGVAGEFSNVQWKTAAGQ